MLDYLSGRRCKTQQFSTFTQMDFSLAEASAGMTETVLRPQLGCIMLLKPLSSVVKVNRVRYSPSSRQERKRDQTEHQRGKIR